MVPRVFAPLIALQPARRRELCKMGDESEVFCRQTLSLLADNPQIGGVECWSLADEVQ